MKRLHYIGVAVAAVTIGTLGCATQQSPSGPGWVTLIDGTKGLENFNQVGTANWTAADGAIQADKGGTTSAFLVSKDSYRDFTMWVEFWASDNANSGIFLRCADPSKITDKTCYEANIFDQRPDPTYGTGAIVNFAKVAPMPKAGGKWNTYEITLRGTRLILVLNGEKTVDIQDGTLASGPFALQWGAGSIKFRKVLIKAI